MLGIVGVYNHRVTCIIGVNPDERVKVQDIFFDVKVKTNFIPSIRSNTVESTINYEQMAEICTILAQGKKHYLLEALACDILNELQTKFQIEWAWIKIKKPNALASAEYALVELEWNR